MVPGALKMTGQLVDPRGVRFGGALTAATAAVAAWLGAWWAAAPVAVVLFAAAFGGPRWNLWAWIYRGTLHPRLGPPDYREPETPPRFANLLGGLGLAGAAVAFAVGGWLVGVVLAVVVAALALVNAATGFCLGCRLYGLLGRANPFSRLLGAR